MNKEVLVMAVALMAVAMLATPLVSAVPGAPKSNEKFQTWHYEKTMNILLLGASFQYIPSFDVVNRLVISWTAGFLTYEITVGGKTYKQGVDFECVDVFTENYYIKPVFLDPGKHMVAEAQTGGLRADTTFDFSVYPGGIEGTLHILEIGNEGGHYTNSLEGTGDLRNVQVKGVWTNSLAFPILTVYDDGTVIGWPT
jgi:hypothetical protein